MQEDVKRILLTPISVSKNKNEIILKNNIIETPQKYLGCLDPDMSDFAVGFYKILYKLEIINGCGHLVNTCFAGDTMNSFNSIANISPGAGKSKKTRTKEENWDNLLRKYFANYHCLANFWVIPLDIGRKSKKLNYYDSMDIFLETTQKKGYLAIFGAYSDYCNWIKNIDDLSKKHFLNSYFPTNTIKYAANNINWKTLIYQAQSRVEARATEISESDFGLSLWLYFNELGLFKPL